MASLRNRDGLLGRRNWRARDCIRAQRRAALIAEPHAGIIGRAADAQSWLSGSAQPPQKREPGAFWVPQFEQSILLGDPTLAGFASSLEACGAGVAAESSAVPLSAVRRQGRLDPPKPLGAHGAQAGSIIERMFEWLGDLTDAQRSAVTHDGGPLRILAGAGTGKTTTLSARVAWLLATGASPERLLLLTFTRRAARQMLARTASLMTAAGLDRSSGSPAGRVTGGTFHAIAHRTLRRYAHTLGIPEGFSVLDAADAADVIDMVRDEQGHAASTRRRFPRKTLLVDLYSAAVNTGRPLSSVVPEMAPWAEDFIDAISEICRGYVRRKRSAGLVDLDDLLLFWRAAVQDDRLGLRLAGALDHVLVDEYQDVNELQVDILTGLRQADPRITVVGDDAQALYSFRAAEPRHILEFDRVFPGSTTVILETNYRSSQQILDVANAVGADATVGFSAVLHAARTAPGVGPQLVRCADEDTQTESVCDRILAHREAGVALHEQAVLVRAAHHSALLELELGARRIPYVKYGGLRFVEAAHVKDLLAAFRLADNPNDVVAWFRLLQLLVGVGPATAHRVVAALGLIAADDAPRDAVSWNPGHAPRRTCPMPRGRRLKVWWQHSCHCRESRLLLTPSGSVLPSLRWSRRRTRRRPRDSPTSKPWSPPARRSRACPTWQPTTSSSRRSRRATSPDRR